MTDSLPLEDFLKAPGILFDVRSPGEFAHAHIPEAVNLPLFSNEERAAVGTIYKQQNSKAAIDLGLKFAGPKLADFAAQANVYAKGKTAKVHCWRGGMRSKAMAWLLNFAGISSVTLKGGYKAFRCWVLQQFSQTYRLIVIGGMTGCGKTEILSHLQANGEQVLNLEALACHRGSAYGMIGLQATQPSTEQFENEIAIRLWTFEKNRPIWIEDESRLLGICHVPAGLFGQIRKAPLVTIEASLSERLERLNREYGKAHIEQLSSATQRISKHLGSQRTKEVIEAISENRQKDAIQMVLQYYDSAYAFSLKKRQPYAVFKTEDGPLEELAVILAKNPSLQSKAII